MQCEHLPAYIIPVSAALPHDIFPVLLMTPRRADGGDEGLHIAKRPRKFASLSVVDLIVLF
jgi:hypothetical protein